MGRLQSTTAAEFARSLAADPAYQARMAAQETASAELQRACTEDEAGLLVELRAVGASVSSVYDFVDAGGAPPAAIPVLLAHLQQSHHSGIWEGIVRALSVGHAHDLALPTLTRLYAAETSSDRRWLLANAVGSMATFTEVAHLDGIEEFQPLFQQSRKHSSRPSA